MSDLENMTAAELRTKLAQYGLPVMPITDSTRSVLIKKLRKAMEGKSDAKNSDNRRSLAKYSSGEDSDMDIGKSTKEKARNRRTTVGGAMLPPASNKLKKVSPKKSEPPPKVEDDHDGVDDLEPVKTHEEVKTVTTRRITRTFKSPVSEEQEDYETGSDSDIDAKNDDNANTTSSFKTTSHRSAATSPYRSRDYSTTLLGNTTLPTTTTTRESVIYPSYSSYTSSDLNSIRSRLGLPSNNYGDVPSRSTSYTSRYSSTYKPLTTTSTTEDVDSPYLSDFTRKLASLKAAEARKSNKDNDLNGSGSYGSKFSYKSSYKRAGDYSPDFRAAGEKNVFKTNLVSFMIVGLGLVFFLGVAFLYLGMKGDVALQLEDKNSVIPICNNGYGEIPSVNCVNSLDVSKAKDLLHTLYPELNKRAEAYGCGKLDKRPFMTEEDILTFYKDPHPARVISDLYNLHVMILQNPNWGVCVLGVDPQNKNNAVPLTSMEYVVNKRMRKETALGLVNNNVPWRCSFTNILYYGSIMVIVLSMIAGVVYGVQKISKAYMAYTKKKRDQIYSMVEQIIDIVSQDNEDNTDTVGQAMAISHVRDMLILPQNREKMAKIWDEAIQFLEKNESRIRFEVEQVAGEEYRTIRWVSPQGSPRARGLGARSWQGQAFETQKGSVNNLTISPTPCLKIRHMVDKNDKNPNMKQIIQDAILDKCGPTCKILHIEIDTSSWCVYVKCATPADAGIVYQSLHGWWYEGNLITVKYIRLERYMEHFPSSPSTGPYLQSSNQK